MAPYEGWRIDVYGLVGFLNVKLMGSIAFRLNDQHYVWEVKKETE